ncbi:MAG: ribonuclease HII [Proteobacteria bacterium]|nr:ribonuclease HII [Pseudomonadota bacterium]
MPDFAHERAARGIVAGIDEAGRGPLAGPVVAAAVVLDRKRLPRDLRDAIDDSKKLSRLTRETIFVELRQLTRDGIVTIGIGAASRTEIDTINILQATFLAMRRAVARLGIAPDCVLVDGNRAPPALGCRVTTLIGGDAASLSIAAASIVAKVVRDRAMMRLARRYPDYGWASNVGYGTAAHIAALGRLGPTPHHRLSFEPLAQRSLLSS